MCYNDFNEKCVKEFCIFSAIIKIFRGVFGASQTPGLISAIRKKQASLIFNYFASIICLPSLVTFHVVFFLSCFFHAHDLFTSDQCLFDTVLKHKSYSS